MKSLSWVMDELRKYHLFRLNPLNITLIYLVLGFLWIAFSDRVLEQMVDDPATLTRLQTGKGWFYVTVTAVLLYFLVNRYKFGITHLRSAYARTFRQYRELLENGNQIVVRVDKDTQLHYVNPKLVMEMGYRPGDVQTLDDIEALIHENDRQRFGEIRKFIASPDENRRKWQLRIRHREEKWRWFLIIAADGRALANVESCLLFIRDIHDENILYEQLREANERFEHLFQEAPVGYHSLDNKMMFIDVNSAELEILGCRREEVIGVKSLADFLEGDDLEAFENHKKEIVEKGAVRNRYYDIRRKDGTVRSVILNAKGFFDESDRLVYTIGNILDLTEKLKAEKELHEAYDELRSLNATLEDKVRERTRELEAANKELEAFAYSVSHDLRAPLRGIDGFSKALLDQYSDTLDQKGRGYLKRVRSASRKMGELIDDLLALSRISRTPLNTEVVDLAELITEIFEALRKNNPEADAELILRSQEQQNDSASAHSMVGDSSDSSGNGRLHAMEVAGDRRLLEIVFQNLIDNAWKFSSRREKIVIEAGVDRIDGDKVFYVRDHGAGFNMKYYEKLFDVFQRLHTQQEFPGTGIGLATVQRIINRHSGRVWAESQPDNGAVFYVSFPDAREVTMD
ncbi:PAS domain S-box protein [Balneolales bacterium ANBcel1]|nr:PAS domain S-box protein [Balneolales bacterium ANBcel1]